MNTPLQTDIWIYRLLVVLGMIVAASVVVTIALTLMGQPVLEILLTLGVVAVSGMIRLLISPLNWGVYY